MRRGMGGEGGMGRLYNSAGLDCTIFERASVKMREEKVGMYVYV